MSQRRKPGDVVWLSAVGGCIGSWKVQRARILDEKMPWMGCVYDCDDDDCMEWANLVTDDGEPVYHVSECQMHDDEQIATRVTEKRDRLLRGATEADGE